MSQLYIRLRTGFYHHRKTALLRVSLGNDAFWIPPRLWAYCAEHQPDGDLSRYSAEQIAFLIGYLGNAQAMLQALKESGFVTSDNQVHGWEEHNGYHTTFSARAKAAADARWKRKKEAKKEKSDDIDIDKGDKHCSSNAASNATSIYSIYPKKVGKPAALRSIAKAINKFGYELIAEKTRLYAEARKSEDPQFTPMPATWFNQERFNDDPSTWGGQSNPARLVRQVTNSPNI